MPENFFALLQYPVVIYAVVGLAVIGILAGFLPQRAPTKRTNVIDPKVQLACVKRVDFRPRPLLNKSEAAVFDALAAVLAQHQPSWRLMAQTSLGEIIEPTPGSGTKSELDNARRSINSKRVDFAAFGPDHNLQLVIEYHGAGHYRGNASARDAVKREVFKRASIPFIELPAKAGPKGVESSLLDALRGEA